MAPDQCAAAGVLLRRQASALQLLAGRLTGTEADALADRAREAIAIASRIDAAADPQFPISK
jgi:hypothetical protein